jgi:dipeptidyl aminopeptidase/acylaminoacyl peptidase
MDELKTLFRRALGTERPPDLEDAIHGVWSRKARRVRRRRLVAGAIAAVFFVGGGSMAWIALRPNTIPRPAENSGTVAITYADHVGSGTSDNYDLFSVTIDRSSLSVTSGLPGEELDPAWSPDGSRLAFVYWPPDGHDASLDVVSSDGTDVRPVVDGRGDEIHDPAWSPDGTRIAYARTHWPEDADGTRHRISNLYVVDVSTGRETQVTDGDTPDFSPSWSPDGSQLVFERQLPQPMSADEQNRIQLVLVNVESPRVSPLTFDHIDRAPAWSPDGSSIVFESDRAGDGEIDLWTIHPDGTGLQQLSTEPGAELAPAWSPDGAAVAFLSEEAGVSGQVIQIIDRSGGAARTVELLFGVAARSLSWQTGASPAAAGIPLYLSVTCQPGSLSVSGAQVAAQTDGSHFLITNATDHVVVFNKESMAPNLTEEFVLNTPPGDQEISCSSQQGEPGPDEVMIVRVQDPHRYWADPVLECQGPTRSTTPLETPAQGEDPGTIVRSFLDSEPRRLSDQLEWAGWPLAETRGVRVVREGAVIGVFFFMPDGTGGWVLSRGNWCANSGINPPD